MKEAREVKKVTFIYVLHPKKYINIGGDKDMQIVYTRATLGAIVRHHSWQQSDIQSIIRK